jgi:hypothetical protein
MHLKNKLSGSVLAVAGTILLSTVPARANLIIAAQSVLAGQNSTGNTLEVTLTNTGPSSVTVGAFAFQITTSDTNITFTGSDFFTTPAPYIFAGDSSFGPILNLLGSGQTMDGSDISASSSGVAVTSGATVGLGRVLFNVSPTAALGPFTVVLDAFPSTNLSGPGPNFANIPINTLTNGRITVTAGTAVPEPASALLLGGALLSLALKRRWFNRLA